MGRLDDAKDVFGYDKLRQSLSRLGMSNSELLEDLTRRYSRSTSPHQPAIVRPPTLLSSIDTITVKELYLTKHNLELCLGKLHRNKVLYGQFRGEFMQTSKDVVTLLVDANGDAICVHASNLVWLTACTGATELRFCVGKQVAIKEPLIEMDSDGLYVLRVINPADVICLDWVNTHGDSPTESSDATTEEALHKIRLDGNHFFAKENWAAAVNRYSQCIHQAVGKLHNNTFPGTISRENLNNVLMLSYTNRAEARLRLQHYEYALSDADEALKIEPNHVKTLAGKGKAAHGLGLYDEACKTLEAALISKESRGVPSIIKCLTASRTFLEQSRTGKYDMLDYFLRGGRGDPPASADFVGPVEIRRASHSEGGRGLFATRDVKAGELLLVGNPLASVLADQNGMVLENLVVELAKRVKTSKRYMAQLYSLVRYGNHEMEVPSMKLFMPGSKWTPPGAENDCDVGIIIDTFALNAFHRYDDSPGKDNKRVSSGLWALPSFANHSCTPNVSSVSVGDTFFFRSSVDIMKGEELTITYLADRDLLNDVKSRQAGTKEGWLFTCKCARCLLEETLRSKLSKISRPPPSLVFDFTEHVQAARTKFRHKRHLWRAAKDLAKVADEVEDAIESHDCKLGPREKGWIRATFLPAFHAKVFFAMEQGDSESTISALELVLDSTTSVGITGLALMEGKVLIEEVGKHYSMDSQYFRLTLDRVLGICNRLSGQQVTVGNL